MLNMAALDRTDGPERLEENAQTIRPNRSPASGNSSFVKPVAPELTSIVEDYSDIGDDGELEEKVAHFKVLFFRFMPADGLIKNTLDEELNTERPLSP